MCSSSIWDHKRPSVSKAWAFYTFETMYCIYFATAHVRHLQVMEGYRGNIWVNRKIIIIVAEILIVLLSANVHGYDSVEQKSEHYQLHVQMSCYDKSAHLDTLEDTAKVQITAFFEFIVIVVSHLAWLSGFKIKKCVWNMNILSLNFWAYSLD